MEKICLFTCFRQLTCSPVTSNYYKPHCFTSLASLAATLDEYCQKVEDSVLESREKRPKIKTWGGIGTVCNMRIGHWCDCSCRMPHYYKIRKIRESSGKHHMDELIKGCEADQSVPQEGQSLY